MMNAELKTADLPVAVYSAFRIIVLRSAGKRMLS
jgi:hypothetical protein